MLVALASLPLLSIMTGGMFGESRDSIPLVEQPKILADGELAPKVSFRLLDGSPLQLERLRGKAVVLDFFGIHCGPCQLLRPKLDALERRLHSDKVKFLTVVCDASLPAVADWVKKHPEVDPTSIVVDPAEKDRSRMAVWKFGNLGTPTVFVLGADGKAIGNVTQDGSTAVSTVETRLRFLGIGNEVEVDYPTIPVGTNLGNLSLTAVSTQRKAILKGPAIVSICTAGTADAVRALTVARQAAGRAPKGTSFYVILLGEPPRQLGPKGGSAWERVFTLASAPAEWSRWRSPCTVLIDARNLVRANADPLNVESVLGLALQW